MSTTVSPEQVRAEQVTTNTSWSRGDLTFYVEDGARYIARTGQAEVAEFYGCPGADTVLLGEHGHMIGSVVISTGREVRIPRGGGMYGFRARFVPASSPVPTLTGWLSAV